MIEFELKQGIYHLQSNTYIKKGTMRRHTLQSEIAADRVINKLRTSKVENDRLDAESDITQNLATAMCVITMEGLSELTIADMQSVSSEDYVILNVKFSEVNEKVLDDEDPKEAEAKAKKSSAGKG